MRLSYEGCQSVSKLAYQTRIEPFREAAMGPLREAIRARRASGQAMNKLKVDAVRGLRTEDFFRHTPITNVKKATEPEDSDYETTDEEVENDEVKEKRVEELYD